MNTFCKLINTISLLIASLSFAWLILSMTGITGRFVSLSFYHGGGVELSAGQATFSRFQLEITRSP